MLIVQMLPRNLHVNYDSIYLILLLIALTISNYFYYFIEI